MKLITGLSLACLTFLTGSAFAENFAIKINENGISFNSFEEKKHGFHWESYRGFIPRNAVEGGREPGRILYICQANYRGEMHPGKIVDGGCNITYAGREIRKSSFNILVGRNTYWAAPYARHIKAIEGGFENGQPLYICQARLGRSFHPGKLVGGNCNIGYGGREIAVSDYMLLASEGHRKHHDHYQPSVGPSMPHYMEPSYPSVGPSADVRPIRPSHQKMIPSRPSVGPSADVRPARPSRPSVGPARPSVGPSMVPSNPSAEVRPIRPSRPSVGPARPSVGPSVEPSNPSAEVRPITPSQPSVGPASPSVGQASPSVGEEEAEGTEVKSVASSMGEASPIVQ